MHNNNKMLLKLLYIRKLSMSTPIRWLFSVIRLSEIQIRFVGATIGRPLQFTKISDKQSMIFM